MTEISELTTLRHSCAHVMAQAVKELWPETKITIGPAIVTGFYYDFDRSDPFTDLDLKKITKRMRRIIEGKPAFTQSIVSKQEALELFAKQNENYKQELIEGLDGQEISIYKTGEKFIDLCKGPHVDNAGEVKAFKLLSVAGAYWRGDEKNARLQRIYGTCFATQEQLDAHLTMLDEAQKRDHRKLGVQLDLFNFYHESAGGGLVFYHPRGARLRKIIEDYICEEHFRRGYEMVMTPHILKGKLWEQSGHADHYRENMYFLDVDDEEYAVKPMNCPGHILIYKSRLRSYRELPIRFFELGTVYRQERAGVLHGLLRVRGFTQDDAHIFCQEDQIKNEVIKVIQFTFDIMNDFGFKDVNIELSTQPKDFIGEQQDWDAATDALKSALEDMKLEYQINEGDGAFYGPKIDVKLKDALQREWQCATIQCDFSLPDRFNLEYVNAQGQTSRPIMIHRAILGSLERFLGTLIEHYAGAFPMWLAPTQVVIIPIKEEHNAYAQTVKDDLQKEGIRVIMDNRNESLSKRIRENTVNKTPYLVIVGDKEAQNQEIAIRRYGQGDIGAMKVADFLKKTHTEVKEKI